MATPSTRSIKGATYVPIDWKNEEDQAVNPERGIAAANFTHIRLYDCANLLASLARDPDSTSIVVAAYRARYLRRSGGELRGRDREAHSHLLALIESHRRCGSHRSLANQLKDVDLDTIRQFARNWLDVERTLLGRSVTELLKAARQAATDLDVWTIPEPSLPVRRSGLGRSIRSRPARDSRGLAAVPHGQIWRRLWEDEQTRVGARFLAGNIAPDQQLTELRREMLEGFLGRITTGVLREAAEGLSESAEVGVAEGIAQSELGAMASMRERQIEAILEAMQLEPAGYLALERLDFTPVGYVKGELVYSLPLTPGEKITVSHREWSNTTEEYVKVVEETIEEEREKSVSEKTELAESTSSEREVSHRGEVSAEAGYRGEHWYASVRGGYEGSLQERRAVETSGRRNQEITSKAASRSKKEHKLSFKVAREVHVEDEQVRVIENTSDQPVRWDFHRLMQKWKIDLYHTGERLTWDIVVPEPAWFLLRKYWELKEITDEIERGDPFDVSAEEVQEDTYESLASEWGAVLEPYPEAREMTFGSSVAYPGKASGGSEVIEIEAPDGYVIESVAVTYPFSPSGEATEVRVIGSGDDSRVVHVIWSAQPTHNREKLRLDGTNKQEYRWVWTYDFEEDADFYTPRIELLVSVAPTDEAKRAWRMESWNRLHEAARARWIVELEGLQAKRDRLMEELTGRDSLKLRQLEREEIMKAALRWMLGSDFRFEVPGLRYLPEILMSSWAEGPESYANIFERIRTTGLEHGEDIRFLHQAIEWENINWITYPYFWGVAPEWSFKQSLEHPDFYHRDFLRAGWARVVLTIRPGYERAWLARMAGLEEDELTGDHPYLSLAEEIEARAHTVYAYTPNPNRPEFEDVEPEDTWYEYTPTGALDIREGTELMDQ